MLFKILLKEQVSDQTYVKMMGIITSITQESNLFGPIPIISGINKFNHQEIDNLLPNKTDIELKIWSQKQETLSAESYICRRDYS